MRIISAVKLIVAGSATLICLSAVAGEIPSGKLTTITGKLSLDKDKIVYISSSDKVVPGGGNDLLRIAVPVTKIPIDRNDYNSDNSA